MSLMPVIGAWIAIAIVLSTLGGCATRPPGLYQWGTYETQVYAHFKNSTSPEQQIAELEKTLLTTPANNRHLPPGYHAHLGLLYGQVGRFEDMKKQLETEKVLFPESAPFMDFLLRKLNKTKGTTL